MGTDIHAVFQRRNGDAWVDVPSLYDERRHYLLFGWLAGVRNGTGFAGIRYGEPLVPIAEPRGLPADFTMVESEDYGAVHPLAGIEYMAPWRQKYHEEGEPLVAWMGDHSHSWLTSDEMFRSAGQCVTQWGVIPREAYAEWDRKGAPNEYSGDVWGRGIIIADEGTALAATASHVRVTWKVSTRVAFAYLFEELQRLHDAHGVIRMVFGFDS